MRRIGRLALLAVVLCVPGTLLAGGNESINGNTSFHTVDFNATSGGAPVYSSWTTPNGFSARFYDLTVTTGSVGGPGTSQIGMCYVLYAATNHDEKFWMQDASGQWISVADDIVGLSPKMVIWMRTGPTVTIRVSDYNSQIGTFSMSTQIWYTTGNLSNDEFNCDSDVSPGLPYVKVAQDGTVTFVRRQGFP
jgi:hypothetical protein